MPYIAPEVIEQARQIDLLTYLKNCEPHELVRILGNNYTTRSHDSLKISMANGCGGRSGSADITPLTIL